MSTAILALENEWAYVGGSYGLVIGLIAAYAVWTIRRGRKIGKQLPPDQRRWL